MNSIHFVFGHYTENQYYPSSWSDPFSCFNQEEVSRAKYLGLDDVIVSVDLQDVAAVTGDGAAGAVIEAWAAAPHVCVADQGLLAVDELAGVMDTAGEHNSEYL